MAILMNVPDLTFMILLFPPFGLGITLAPECFTNTVENTIFVHFFRRLEIFFENRFRIQAFFFPMKKKV